MTLVFPSFLQGVGFVGTQGNNQISEGLLDLTYAIMQELTFRSQSTLGYFLRLLISTENVVNFHKLQTRRQCQIQFGDMETPTNPNCKRYGHKVVCS